MPDTPTLLADVIVPSKFLPYMVEQTARLSALWQSGIVEASSRFNELVRSSGMLIDMPFWTQFNEADQVIQTNSTLTVKKLAGSADKARKQMRGIPVGSEDLIPLYADTDDPITVVAGMFGKYWADRLQEILIATLKGVFGAANMAAAKANVFTEDGNAATDANKFTGDTFIDAETLLGDAAGKLTAIAIHSATLASLKKQDLIDYLPDSEGKPTIAVYQGKRVIVDDGLPVRAGVTSGNVYTSYLFGQGALAFGEGNLDKPVQGGHGTEALELSRTALAGQTAIISRRQFMLHPRGVKWLDAAVASTHPTNTELENSANWTRVYEQKNVRIVQFNHNN
jgi:hypothetical protein